MAAWWPKTLKTRTRASSGGSTDGGRQHARLAGNDGTQPGVGMATGVGGKDGKRHAGLAGNTDPGIRPEPWRVTGTMTRRVGAVRRTPSRRRQASW